MSFILKISRFCLLTVYWAQSYAVDYLLGFWRESHKFRSFEKENILWRPWPQITKWGLHILLHLWRVIGWVSWLWIEICLSSDISFMQYININDRFGVCFWDTIHMTQHMLRENSWSRSRSPSTRPLRTSGRFFIFPLTMIYFSFCLLILTWK